MRRYLSTGTIVPAAILAAVVWMVVAANVRESRRTARPVTSPAVRTRLPSTSRESLDEQISRLEQRIASSPDEVSAAVQLSEALLRQTRVTGNAGLSARAGQLLERAAAADPGSYDVSRMLGSLYLSQHRFRQALEVGERCRAIRPSDPVNYGVIGDAHVELGEYDEAFDAFDHMMQLRPSASSYARVGYARELQGNLEGALEAMKLAAAATSAADLEALAWVHSQVGELHLKLGQPRRAQEEFAVASQAFPGHPFAVAGYARSLEALGDQPGALHLMEDLVRRAPTPDFYARTGNLAEKLGRREAASRYFALAEAAWRSDAPEPKNLARFLADRGARIDEAVTIAEQAALSSRDIFTRDALAWAYYKAKRIDDARREMRMALRTGTKDRDILAHARAIGVAGHSGR
jgi:tetratricopeptide (TPR) repeat protein